ncbi:MAG: NAD(P)-binding domain-containing protein [Henriciella sp.]|nr:NAD(P)-binding domain-containing protein [Henriciella sp.]MBO6696878.1 NAD(P)-binding domain-containing protein [Henriciella sp.]
MKIGILGAGSVGRALAGLIRAACHEPLISERTPSGDTVSFEDAATAGEIVIIAVPYNASEVLLPSLANALAGKIVVDATNPLNDDWTPKVLGAETSAAEEIAKLLPGSQVVKAFNTVFADIMAPEKLTRLGVPVTGFVASDHDGARRQVADLAKAMGLAPVETGPLATARYLEAMAHLNIAIAVGQSGGTDAAFLYHQAAG